LWRIVGFATAAHATGRGRSRVGSGPAERVACVTRLTRRADGLRR
jgi:hypothetical protein